VKCLKKKERIELLSFCGKTQEEVKKLIAGPNVYICDECIDLCNEILKMMNIIKKLMYQ